MSKRQTYIVGHKKLTSKFGGVIKNMGFLKALPLAAQAQTGSDWGSILTMALTFIPLILIFYFLLIRPQRKKDKEAQKMRNNIQVGDEVTTIGGVIGRVVSLKDDSIVIETGADRSKLRLKKWAIQTVDTIHEEEK